MHICMFLLFQIQCKIFKVIAFQTHSNPFSKKLFVTSFLAGQTCFHSLFIPFDILYYNYSLFTEIIINQNDVIMKTLSEHKVLTERVLYQEVTQNNLASTFPLDSINGLNEINKTINENNRNDYVSVLIKYLNMFIYLFI